MGNCIVTSTQIVCDEETADIAANRRKIQGAFEFWTRTTTVVPESTVTTYKFGGVVAAAPSADACTQNCELTGRESSNDGFYDNETYQIDGVVKVGAPASSLVGGENVTIVYTPGPQQQQQQQIIAGGPTNGTDTFTNQLMTAADGTQVPISRPRAGRAQTPRTADPR
ncbi:hypothetical protein CQ031_14450 [Microbacterium sp. MYb40]|nr:hypothetical protein CQ031_14450 [Microbacterium sp. MYb40]PRB66127.1 hypothetical protein CQ027_19615 [Microbacterium sp. MYb32]